MPIQIAKTDLSPYVGHADQNCPPGDNERYCLADDCNAAATLIVKPSFPSLRWEVIPSLIEVEFHNVTPVIEAWSSYITHLNTPRGHDRGSAKDMTSLFLPPESQCPS
jgi:hypothetical protein